MKQDGLVVMTIIVTVYNNSFRKRRKPAKSSNNIRQKNNQLCGKGDILKGDTLFTVKLKGKLVDMCIIHVYMQTTEHNEEEGTGMTCMRR